MSHLKCLIIVIVSFYCQIKIEKYFLECVKNIHWLKMRISSAHLWFEDVLKCFFIFSYGDKIIRLVDAMPNKVFIFINAQKEKVEAFNWENHFINVEKCYQ